MAWLKVLLGIPLTTMYPAPAPAHCCLPGHSADAEVHTDSSDSTDHLHDAHAGSNTRSIEQLQQQAGRRTPAQNALGRFAYFITSITPGGGRELLFADDYNEAEADGAISDGDDGNDAGVIGTEDDYDEDDVIQGGDDKVIEDTEGEDDVTFDVEGLEGGEGQEGEQGVRRGAPRPAKTVAMQRLAELAHFEHPRTA
jgi:hypothetical protein